MGLGRIHVFGKPGKVCCMPAWTVVPLENPFEYRNLSLEAHPIPLLELGSAT
jgi:hypothetical protein